MSAKEFKRSVAIVASLFVPVFLMGALIGTAVGLHNPGRYHHAPTVGALLGAAIGLGLGTMVGFMERMS